MDQQRCNLFSEAVTETMLRLYGCEVQVDEMMVVFGSLITVALEGIAKEHGDIKANSLLTYFHNYMSSLNMSLIERADWLDPCCKGKFN